MAPECWTLEALREHLMAIIEANDARYEQRFTDLIRSIDVAQREAERAISKAEDSNKTHFQILNNYKELSQERERVFVPRPEYELAHASLEKRMDEAMDQMRGRIEVVAKCMNRTTGESSGAKQGWAMAVAVIAALTALVSMFIHIAR